MNPQRINIQYSLELNELAAEVKKLYKKADAEARSIGLIQYSESQILSSSLLKHVHETRLKLAKVDIMLADIQAIVNSYVEYEVSQSKVPSQDDDVVSPIPGEMETAYSDLSALTQQLQENLPHEEPTQGS